VRGSSRGGGASHPRRAKLSQRPAPGGRDARFCPLLCEWQVNTIFEELKKHVAAGEKFLALEKFQNLILMGLSLRTGFFRHAALFGGTSLRIFHGLPRFSEDLDFTVDSAASDFTLLPYRESLSRFFEEIGIGQVKFTAKSQSGDVATSSVVLPISRSESLRVKIDAEQTQFALAPETETLYGSFPFQYPVRICRLSSGFANRRRSLTPPAGLFFRETGWRNSAHEIRHLVSWRFLLV